MSNLNRLKMKNLIMFLLVSFFTTQLLATEMLNVTKIENSIVTKISIKDKPIIFENFKIKKDKPKNGFNYKKHHKKTKHTKTLNKLFDRNHCNNYRQGQS
jgi:hypothetical protein